MKLTSMLLLLLLSCMASQAQIRYLTGTLQASQQVPANASTASGVAIIRYNTATKVVEAFANYNGLTTAITATHIHSGAAGTNGPVLVPLNGTGGTTGTISGSGTLTAAQETDLLAGNMYLNVHTSTYPGGEIRAQLTASTDAQTEFYNARVQSAQQVPPNGSAGFGAANILLDKGTHTVYVTGSFSGLTAAATAAHIHVGAVGTNGAVIIPFTVSNSTSGTVHAVSSISTTNEAEMVAGNTYVNIHTSTYPGGEIRGQVGAFSQLRYLTGVLQSSQQVPPNASTAKGTAIIKYNTTTRLLEVFADYQDLTTAITATHIHSPGAAGTNAPVLIPLTATGGTTGSISGSATLTAAQETDLFNGLMYLNVHTATYPGGEIRGQLTLTTAGETQFFKGTLQGTQQVPTNASSGSGTVTALLDKVTNQVFVTATFTGLTTAATAAHIHQATTGVNGPVVVPLSVNASTAGSVTGSATVSAAFATEMINGNTYVNIHNSTFPGGELRAQLGDLALPVKLLFFNGYKVSNTINLVWQSATEVNVRSYEVEQQTDAGTWKNKGSVSALGNKDYKFVDVPLLGSQKFLFYRLKIVDRDGRTSYSPVIKINFSQTKGELTILNNPVVNGELQYSITGLSTNTNVDVFVIDRNGRVVLKATSESYLNNRLNVNNLAAGLYQLVIKTSDATLTQSFMK